MGLDNPVLMNWRNHLEAAEGYLEIGLPVEAMEEIERMPADDKSRTEVYAMRLRCCIALKQWDLAEILSSHLTRVRPDVPDYWLARAVVVEQALGTEAAEQVLFEASDRFPETGAILYAIACTAALQGDVTRAKVMLATAIGHDSTLKARAIDDEDLRAVWDEIQNMG